MEVSRSGYYEWRKKKGSVCAEDEKLKVQIRAIHRETRGSYGSRRMAEELQSQGHPVGRYKARRLMREAGVEVRRKRRFRRTTDSRHRLPVFPNILDRAFDVGKANAVWGSDITYLWTKEGWLYVTVLLDLYSRRVIGWAMDSHMRAELVEDALNMALGRRQPLAGLLHHSDQGNQYASGDYQALLSAHGIVCSMSRKGNCWDNAVVERFFGSLKREWTDDCLYETRQQAKSDVIQYIEMFYNSRRRHSHLGYLTPIEFEQRWENLQHAA